MIRVSKALQPKNKGKIPGLTGIFPLSISIGENTKIMRLRGIEPPHAAPEATALSTELQTHHIYNTILLPKMQAEI